MDYMLVDRVLPDTTSSPISEESIDRIREFSRKNRDTHEQHNERKEYNDTNMFEIPELFHILTVSLFLFICKKLHTHFSSVRSSLVRLFLEYDSSVLYHLDLCRFLMHLPLVASLVIYSTRCS